MIAEEVIKLICPESTQMRPFQSAKRLILFAELESLQTKPLCTSIWDNTDIIYLFISSSFCLAFFIVFDL